MADLEGPLLCCDEWAASNIVSKGTKGFGKSQIQESNIGTTHRLQPVVPSNAYFQRMVELIALSDCVPKCMWDAKPIQELCLHIAKLVAAQLIILNGACVSEGSPFHSKWPQYEDLPWCQSASAPRVCEVSANREEQSRGLRRKKRTTKASSHPPSLQQQQ